MEGGRLIGFALRTSHFTFQREPCLDVLLQTFLYFQIRRDDDERPLRENFSNQNRKKRLRRLANARTRQHSAILQSPCKGLHGGSLQNVSKQVACR